MDKSKLKDIYINHVIDNRNVSMVEVIKYLLDQENNKSVDIAVGYFYISGMLLLKKEFINFFENRNGHLRILMGNETNGATVNVLSKENFDNYSSYISEKTQNDIKEISDKEFLGKVAEWIKSGRFEVKVYTGEANYFHAKSYLFSSSLDSYEGTAIVGSSNFSKAGLQGNTELNFLTRDGYTALHEWYSNLWLSDEVDEFSTDLIDITVANGAKLKLQEYKPVKETYFDFANLYAKPYIELNENTDWAKDLYPHQRSGIVAIKEKLDTYDTAVLSDGVGLGKTRTAAGIIRLYLGSQIINNILIVADNKLKTQWKEELQTLGVKPHQYSYLSRQQLINIDSQELARDKFTLVIVDEAHLGFKNNNTEAYQKLLKLKQDLPDLKGLMLTATPWNNKREDVVNIGSLFLNKDTIPNDRLYKQYFLLSPGKLTNKVVHHLAQDDKAFKEFWSDIYLQRTRKTYGGEGASFPHRNFPTVNIPYEPRKNEIFSNNFEIISRLRFPYQDPIKYLDKNKKEIGAEQQQMLLLKRADSSWKAFEVSLLNIIKKLKNLKSNLDRISLLKGKTQLREYVSYLRMAYDSDNYEFRNNIGSFAWLVDNEQDNADVKQSRRRKQSYMNRINKELDNLSVAKAKKAIERMVDDCNQDLDTLESLVDDLEKAYVKDGKVLDEKANKILECVEEERKKGHKVILISQFADTVQYYYDFFHSHFNKEKITYPMGMITGGLNNDSKYATKLNQDPSTKEDVLDHFSPKSKQKENLIEDNREVDLIIATDTISTGQNLQDAVTLMNIDLPYNPMVLEQRIGRIDRPSKDNQSKEIYIFTFPVYESINSELKMMKRLGSKMEGVLTDTQFDNVVLPQYEGYLNDVKKAKANALQNMLDKTDEQVLYHSDIASEQHSADYEKANKRMYNFKSENIKPLKSPILAPYSFSFSKNPSVLVIEINYYDTNNVYLDKEQIIINGETGSTLDITEAEKFLNSEIIEDVANTKELSKEKATKKIEQVNEIVDKVRTRAIERYNTQHKFVKDNIETIQNSVAKKAAVGLKESAEKNPSLVISKLNSVNVEPKDLGKIINYIKTIDKDSDLYSMVQDISNNPEVFWLNIEDYMTFFSPDKIDEAKRIGQQIRDISNRQADFKNTKFKTLLANLVINKTK